MSRSDEERSTPLGDDALLRDLRETVARMDTAGDNAYGVMHGSLLRRCLARFTQSESTRSITVGSATPTFDAANKYAHEHFASWSDRYEYLMGEFKRLECGTSATPSAGGASMDRSTAVNLARNIVDDEARLTSVSPVGVACLADAVMRMDAYISALGTPQSSAGGECKPVAWYRIENGLRVYYETEAWPNMTPLYSTPQSAIGALQEDPPWPQPCPECGCGNRLNGRILHGYKCSRANIGTTGHSATEK